MPYRVAADLLQHLLPIDIGKSPETLSSHMLNGTVEIDRIPVNNRGGDEAQTRRAETLVLKGAVSNFPR